MLKRWMKRRSSHATSIKEDDALGRGGQTEKVVVCTTSSAVARLSKLGLDADWCASRVPLGNLFKGSAQHVFSYSVKVSMWSDEHGYEDRFDRFNCFTLRCSRQWSTGSAEFFPLRLQNREVKYLDEGDPPNN